MGCQIGPSEPGSERVHGFKKRARQADECLGMPDHPNPFAREGLLRRTALFGVALAAGYAMVPMFAPGEHRFGDFSAARSC